MPTCPIFAGLVTFILQFPCFSNNFVLYERTVSGCSETVNLCLSKCMSQKRSIYSNRTVSYLIVIDCSIRVYQSFLCDMYFDKQVLHRCSIYYASIMVNAFRHLLCSLLCQHNWWVPKNKMSLLLARVHNICMVRIQML